MFTGLIEEIGIVTSIQSVASGLAVSIHAEKILQGLDIDDSVAVNGSCLTVENINENIFSVTAVQETVDRTTLKQIRKGDVVNLERAMRLSDRLDGHLVQGHVDGTAVIESVRQAGVGWIFCLEMPEYLIRYIVEKGSIAVDGISVTIASVQSNHVQIAVIPHTFQTTIFKMKKTGDSVNIETDIIGKYVERMLNSGSQKTSHSENWYRSQGY